MRSGKERGRRSKAVGRFPEGSRIAIVALVLGPLAPVVKGYAFFHARDAESGFANPLAISGEGTAATWNVVNAKVDELRRAGYDALGPGQETIDGLDVTWEVEGQSPKRVTILVQQIGGTQVDSFTTFVAKS